MTAPVTTDSPRSRGVALALAVPLGWCGAHRFYAGKVGTGLLMLCTGGGLGLWWLYDMILVASGEFRDSDGLHLRRWNVDETRVRTSFADHRLDQVLEQLEGLRSEVSDLAERLDFAERMLAQQRERDRLPRA